jgi:hypothetical protein
MSERSTGEQNLTVAQIDTFVARARELILGSPTIEMLTSADGETQAQDIIATRETETEYILEDKSVYVEESVPIVGYQHHPVRLVIVSAQRINQDYFSITRKTYEVDLIDKSPHFSERTEIYEATTQQRVKTPEAEEGIRLVLEGGTPEESSSYLEGMLRRQALDKDFGYSGFTQDRFSEAMHTLDQLGPHNRRQK